MTNSTDLSTLSTEQQRIAMRFIDHLRGCAYWENGICDCGLLYHMKHADLREAMPDDVVRRVETRD